MKRIITTISIVFLAISLVYPHSGRTDNKGGHHDRINGGYHYHHGHGPHQHPGGVCELTSKRQGIRSYSSESQDSGYGWIWPVLGFIGYLFYSGRRSNT